MHERPSASTLRDAEGCATLSQVVGDRCFDVAAAHAHSLSAIGVTWGIGSRDELSSAGADVIVDDPSELKVAVSDLMPGGRPGAR
ncbi:MAG: HAD hydrolase-like protein [Candidatus Dormibacteria bacterium]|jgi:phosphoglycolate phosphatase